MPLIKITNIYKAMIGPDGQAGDRHLHSQLRYDVQKNLLSETIFTSRV